MPPRSRGIPLGELRRAVLNSNGFIASRRSICSECYRTLSAQSTIKLESQHLRVSMLTRTFTTTSLLSKKSSNKSSPKNQPKSSSVSEHIPNNKATKARDAEVDPYDFSELDAGIAQAISKFKDALTKTRDAGRVTTEMVEDLPVELTVKGGDTHGSSGHKEKTRIGDIASAAPKGGRAMQVFCGEESHVKPITSALQASPYSLTPQADAHNPLLLIVQVPPATAETRAQAAAEAKKVMEKASLAVRTARGDAQKRFRKMELAKVVVQDELRKAHKEMEEVVKKGQDEVKKVLEAALKSLER